ncbi:IclR family transcriptional regulator C-terminal domain-containing protein [Streptomyces viridochromogenes]|nr:IclR family transcriptional regulator C-terminal domain-containing protein [Streptomyces viridochromogenes]
MTSASVSGAAGARFSAHRTALGKALLAFDFAAAE